MGLDVYFHHTRVAFEGNPTDMNDINKFTDKVDELARQTFREKAEKLLEPLQDAWDKAQENDYWKLIYNDRYFAFVEKLRPLIAKNYDFKLHPFIRNILDFPELKQIVEEECKQAYEEYDIYFRKVNFLFAYFTNKGSMVDQYFTFVTKEDADDIIDRCEKVLKDHSKAKELLPTRGGFFFGSTDYDEWYFSNVKDCLSKMKKYRKLLKDGVTGYIIFSW